MTHTKPFFAIVVLALVLVAIPSVAAAQHGFVHTDGTGLVDGQGHSLMLRGTNLGNWLVQEGYMFHLDHGPQSAREIEALANELLGPEAAGKFWKTYRERYVTRDDIQFLKRAGFNSVRIPIHYKYFTSDDAEGFALLDRVIEWAREAGLYVVIDACSWRCGTRVCASGPPPVVRQPLRTCGRMAARSAWSCSTCTCPGWTGRKRCDGCGNSLPGSAACS